MVAGRGKKAKAATRFFEFPALQRKKKRKKAPIAAAQRRAEKRKWMIPSNVPSSFHIGEGTSQREKGESTAFGRGLYKNSGGKDSGANFPHQFFPIRLRFLGKKEKKTQNPGGGRKL